MGPTAVGLYAIGLIGVCSALPIQSVNTGKLCFPLELLPICKQAAGLMNGWKSWHELRILISRPRCSNVREKIAMWWWKLRRVVVSHEKLLLLRQWLLTLLCAMQLFRLLFLQFRLCQRECTISKPNARAPVGTYCCKIVPIRFLEKGSGNQCLHKYGKEEKQKKSYQKEFYTKK